jgi:hypothetical protein
MREFPPAVEKGHLQGKGQVFDRRSENPEPLEWRWQIFEAWLCAVKSVMEQAMELKRVTYSALLSEKGIAMQSDNTSTK